jgi:hypothetical protein
MAPVPIIPTRNSSPPFSNWQYSAATWLIIGAFAAARLAQLTAVCLDGDEIFSVTLVRETWPELLRKTAWDAVHPPLFYCLLKVWVAIGGEGLWWVRLLPALLGIAAAAPWYLLCRELRLPRLETNLALALGAVHPLLLYYSQHVRMYSLFLLLSLVSLWLFTRGRRAALALINTLLVYTHYFGWLLIAIQCVFGKRRAVAANAVPALLFLPWAVVAAGALAAKGGLDANLAWVPKPGLAELTWFFGELSGWTTIGAWGLVPAAVWLAALPRKNFPWLLAAVSVAPAVAALLVSRILPESVWGHRHLIFAAPAFLMLCALSLGRMPRKAAAALVAAWLAFAVRDHLDAAGRKIHWDAMAQVVMRDGTREFQSVDPYLGYAMRYYLGPEVRVRRTAEPEPALRAWYAYIDARWSRSETPEALLARKGCLVGPTRAFRDRYRTVYLFAGACTPQRPSGDRAGQ